MKINKKNISKGLFAYFFFLIAVEPAAFQHYFLLDKIFTIAQVAMFFIVFLFSFFKGSKINISRKSICILMIIYYLYFILITFAQNGRTQALLIQAIHFIGFALYLDLVIKNNKNEIFRSLLNILMFYVTLNFIIVFVFKNGLYTTNYYSNNYLLGYDNQNINFILPTLILILLKHKTYKKCIVQVCFIYLIAWATAIKIWSGMTIVVVAITTLVRLYFLLDLHIGFEKIFTLKVLFPINIIANIGLVFFQIQNYFEYIIVNVLHRSLTLTERTLIWEKTLGFIKKRFVFGYGREQYTLRAIKYGKSEYNPIGLHSHNRLLETIYSGGIILLILYLSIIFRSANFLHKYRKTRFSKIISLGIFIYFIGMLSEYYDYCIFLWGFLVLSENISYYVSCENGE